jgi:hypothetical protein
MAVLSASLPASMLGNAGAAGGLVVYLVWHITNEVRTARVLGTATSKALHGHQYVGSGAVRNKP